MELPPARHLGLQGYLMRCCCPNSLANSVHLLHLERGVDCD